MSIKLLTNHYSARDLLTALYLEYRNNYLTIPVFAEHNGITDAQAVKLIELAKNVYNSKHPEA